MTGQINVFDDVVLDKNGSYVKGILAFNIDGIGTEFGINGRLGNRRKMYEGTFSSSEARRFSVGISSGKAMPVPLEDGYSAVSPAENEKVGTLLRRDQHIISSRPYSSAANPTKNGWDMKTFIYANADNSVDAKIVPRTFLEPARG